MRGSCCAERRLERRTNDAVRRVLKSKGLEDEGIAKIMSLLKEEGLLSGKTLDFHDFVAAAYAKHSPDDECKDDAESEDDEDDWPEPKRRRKTTSDGSSRRHFAAWAFGGVLALATKSVIQAPTQTQPFGAFSLAATADVFLN